MNDHRLNIKCSVTDNEPNILIRSNERNTFDATVAILAIPFNGVLLKSKVENYRFRKAMIIPVTEDVANSYPQVAEYEYIFYCIVEPNITTLIEENHARYTERIRVSIITKVPGEATGVNHMLDFYKDNENLVSKYHEKTWNTENSPETQPMEMPFKVFLPGVEVKKETRNTNNNRRSNNTTPRNAGGYSNGYNNDNVNRKTTNNRNEKSYQKNRDHSYDDGFDNDGGGRYPAKKQKTMKNRNNRGNGFKK